MSRLCIKNFNKTTIISTISGYSEQILVDPKELIFWLQKTVPRSPQSHKDT